ncbi:DNA cytosine methyltransferase [Geoalkalibacter halelectricus]|uniref:DNA cytosine methyltransferase n=1 Tax=Geoalkalibacter halelectricus TaxID=2847045 RepID=UPI00267053F2|nr:DNA cytosine methyltransferase [Geoalkalibacter halelectricus]MDO3380406.1 DNA cytosine methyltransferase [Geoalkalibacter halelectricus]
MKNYAITKIGQHRSAPRVWLQGRHPESAGFLPTTRFTVEVKKEKGMIALRAVATGERKVSSKEVSGRTVPIIDINSREILSIFEGMEQIRVIAAKGVIYLLPLATEVRRQERLARLKNKLAKQAPLSVGSVSHGGGVLSLALHQGLAEGHTPSRLAFANDIRGDLLEHAAQANPAWDSQTIALASPMQELAYDQWAMAHIPSIDILEGGIPCEGASVSGRSKRGTGCAEEHPLVGHLVAGFLAIIAKVNPSIVIMENVVPYQSTASMWILRHSLRDMGYDVHETILDGAEFNALEHRQRMCLVAVTQGIEFDFSALVKPKPTSRYLGDILENIPEDAPCWSEMGYLKDKEKRDAQAGKGFVMQIVTPDSTKVGTIGKGYNKNRSTEPKVAHPTNPSLLRLLTPREHARCKGIPECLVEGLAATTAHELLGQSIVFDAFHAVGRLIADTLQEWVSLNGQQQAA